MRRFVSFVVIKMLLCAAAFAGTIPATEMIGGTPATPRVDELDEYGVLLVQDNVSFWGNSNQEILDMLPEVTYDIIYASMIPLTDLDAYNCIIIEGNQPATFNQRIIDNMDLLEAYVANGGWLQFHMATNRHTPNVVLWDGVHCQFDEGIHDEITNFMGPDGAGHPALHNVEEPYLGNPLNLGYVAELPVGAAVIVETSTGLPTYAEYSYGSGNVIVTTIGLEYVWNYTGFNSGDILYNTIVYTSSNGEVPQVVLNLTPAASTVSNTGGNVVYSANLVSQLDMTIPGLSYQSFVTLPSGEQLGPINTLPFTHTPFMNATVPNMTLNVPGYAPTGDYMFIGVAGFPNNPAMQVSDSFRFTKLPPFGDGLNEDFEDGIAQDFEWSVGETGSYSIDGGYAKLNTMESGLSHDHGSGYYDGDVFSDFSASTTMELVQTVDNSNGMTFRGSGTYDMYFTGYAVYLSGGYWSAWIYIDYYLVNLVGWTFVGEPAINSGTGAINVLQVDATGSTFDVSCNGYYLGSFTNSTYTSGYVGIVSQPVNETWYDDVQASHTPAPAPTSPALIGELDPVLRDHTGKVITDPADFYTPGVAFDRSIELKAADFRASSDFISEQQTTVIPTEFTMSSAYPNPFNPTTTVAVNLPETSNLTVTVYNITGQQVAMLVSGRVAAGQHNFVFDGKGLSSGLYFIHATIPGQLDAIQKVTLMK